MFVTIDHNLIFRNDIHPMFASIAFNGVILENGCLEADSESGYVDLFARDCNNNLIILNDRFRVHRLFGRVEIRDRRL